MNYTSYSKVWFNKSLITTDNARAANQTPILCVHILLDSFIPLGLQITEESGAEHGLGAAETLVANGDNLGDKDDDF